MATEKEIKNRLRCLSCDYYGLNCCTLMVNADVFKLDMCILDIVKKKKWNADSPELFMFRKSPLTLLSYLSYCRRNILPKKGTKVLTLRAGFTGGSGVFRWVDEITDTTIILRNESGQQSISYKECWFCDFFAFDKFN